MNDYSIMSIFLSFNTKKMSQRINKGTAEGMTDQTSEKSLQVERASRSHTL